MRQNKYLTCFESRSFLGTLGLPWEIGKRMRWLFCLRLWTFVFL